MGIQDKSNHHIIRNVVGSSLLNYAQQAPAIAANFMHPDNPMMMPPMLPTNVGQTMSEKLTTFYVRVRYPFNLLMVRDVQL